jgi:predicted kinase
VSTPALVVVSGAPGSGKTTLAHTVARHVGCPAVCRDEIREGMAHAGTADPTMRRTLDTFFDTLGVLLRAGVTVVAESAFEDRLWRPILSPLAGLATIRIIRCTADARVARDRIARRLATDRHRAAHRDRELLRGLDDGTRSLADWTPIALSVPTLVVDTSDGYRPGLDTVVAFAAGPRH